MIHTVEGFGVLNKAEIDVFLAFSCSVYDPADVGNLISGSSAFSKSSLNIWKFSVHVVLKHCLENFEHYFARVWASQVAQHLPAKGETWVKSLGQEDPQRRKWQHTPVLLPGKFHGMKSLVGYSPWGHKELDMTE